MSFPEALCCQLFTTLEGYSSSCLMKETPLHVVWLVMALLSSSRSRCVSVYDSFCDESLCGLVWMQRLQRFIGNGLCLAVFELYRVAKHTLFILGMSWEPIPTIPFDTMMRKKWHLSAKRCEIHDKKNQVAVEWFQPNICTSPPWSVTAGVLSLSSRVKSLIWCRFGFSFCSFPLRIWKGSED